MKKEPFASMILHWTATHLTTASTTCLGSFPEANSAFACLVELQKRKKLGPFKHKPIEEYFYDGSALLGEFPACKPQTRKVLYFLKFNPIRIRPKTFKDELPLSPAIKPRTICQVKENVK